MIVYFSDFDLRGSGYQGIGVALCQGLAARGRDVLVFGMGYKRESHDYDFRLCPASFKNIPQVMKVLPTAPDIKVEAWVTAFDIPLQLGLLFNVPDPGPIPRIGIFPIESDPLCQTWAMRLMMFDKRLIISDFGVREAGKAGVEATHLPIGIDLDFWKPPDPDERRQLRESMEFANKFVVLTVADNHERKNLSLSMQIFADVAEELDAVYLLVTRQNSPVGWVLHDLAATLGISERFFVWERGIKTEELRDLFWVSDCFLLASKAEGLGMPVLEALAAKLPVVATKCTALEDHLKDRRGFLIEPDYRIVDPWGNSHRYFMDREKAGAALRKIAGATPSQIENMTVRGRTYAEMREWSKAVDVLERAIYG